MRLRHEPIEIGAQRGAAIVGERRAHPAGERRVPRALEIAARRAPRPPASSAAAVDPGFSRELLVHASQDPPVDGAALGRAARVCAWRSSALAHQSSTRSCAGRPSSADRSTHRLEQLRPRRRSDRRDTALRPSPIVSSTRSRGIERARGSTSRSDSRACVEVARVRRSGGTARAECGRARHAPRRSAREPRAASRREPLGRLVLADVVQAARLGQRIGRGRRGPRQREQQQQHGETRAHGGDGSTSDSCALTHKCQ